MKDFMYGYIYKVTNLVNNKIYIGQHKSNFFNENYKGSGVAITAAKNKYGVDNFKVELIEKCNNKEELNKKEIYYIDLYDSRNSSVGYNLTAGGLWSDGFKGHKHSEDSKKKISKGNFLHPSKGFAGRHHTEKSKEKIRLANKGKTISEKGREALSKRMKENNPVYREDVRKKLSEANKGRRMTDEQKLKISKALKDRPSPNKGNKASFETRKKHSEDSKSRNWYNNGIIEVFRKSKPDGFIKGRLK